MHKGKEKKFRELSYIRSNNDFIVIEHAVSQIETTESARGVRESIDPD